MTGTLLGGLPPFLVGVVVAVVLETSTGLLLYVEEGFLPALTLILVVESGALALGLWTGALSAERPAIEQVRRHWIVALVTLTAAAAFSAWSASGWGGYEPSGVGLGWDLAVLGALPLFAVGSLLGAMTHRDDVTTAPVATIGLPSLLGIAVGFLLSGALLLPNTVPHTLYLLCLVALSGGALLQGWVLDGRPLAELKAASWSESGELRAEERVLGRPRREVRVLTEGGRLRGAEDWSGEPVRRWERALADGLSRKEEPPSSLLYVGGGSGTLARILSGTLPNLALRVMERSEELVAFARQHLLPWDGWADLRLQTGDPIRNLSPAKESWELVVVDAGVLPVLGDTPFLAPEEWSVLAEATGGRGYLVMGGLRVHPGRESTSLERVLRGGKQVFADVAVLVADTPADTPGLLPGEDDAGLDAILVCSKETEGCRDLVFPEFSRAELDGA